MINGSCLNFVAEILFATDESMFYIIKKESVQFFASVERTQNFCDILSSNSGAYWALMPKKFLFLPLSSEISYLVNDLEVDSMQSWNKFKFKCPSSLSCFNENN